jgi:transposase-like protein
MSEISDTDTGAPSAVDVDDDPIEDRLRRNIRATIEALFEEELEAFLGRCRYGRRSGGAREGYRHGRRERRLAGTFGTTTVSVPRARVEDEAGEVGEWRSQALSRYQRRTRTAEALIASLYLAGTNTRRVERALYGLFRGAVGPPEQRLGRGQPRLAQGEGGLGGTGSARGLAGEDIVRLIVDGTVVKTRIDKKATNITVLAAIGVRRDGQKVLLAIRNICSESKAAWSAFLADLDARGPRRPEFVVADGAPGLEAALTALWGEDLAIQRCTVHKPSHLLAHAPKALHDELSEDDRDMIYAETVADIETRRQAFLEKWRLECPAVAASLEEAGERLFAFTRLPAEQWRSARTTNAIERLNEEFRRRLETQTVLPAAETAPMLFWALLASGQIVMRKVDGWQSLDQPLEPTALDRAA